MSKTQCKIHCFAEKITLYARCIILVFVHSNVLVFHTCLIDICLYLNIDPLLTLLNLSYMYQELVFSSLALCA